MSKFKYPVQHLSNSSIKLYLSCPFAFKAKYILGMKQPGNEHFALGKAVHGAAELQSRFRIKHNKNLPLDVVLERYQQLTKKEAASLNRYGRDALRVMHPVGHDLVEKLYYYQCQRPPVLVEQYFKVDLGFDLPLLGYIDVVFEDDALRDYKTASKPWRRNDLDTALQFTIYNEAYKKLYGHYPKSLGTIELDKKLIISQPDQAIREQLTSRGGKHWEKAEIMIQAVIDGLKAEKYPRCGKRSCWACGVM